VSIEVRNEAETIWFTQMPMDDLFEMNEYTIGEHVGYVYGQKELIRATATRRSRTVQAEGSRYIPVTMKNRDNRRYQILKVDAQEIAEDAGAAQERLAQEHVESEWETCRVIQDRLFESVIDHMTRELRKSGREVEE
jgi:hypothetical protein